MSERDRLREEVMDAARMEEDRFAGEFAPSGEPSGGAQVEGLHDAPSSDGSSESAFAGARGAGGGDSSRGSGGGGGSSMPVFSSQEVIDALWDNQVGDARLLIKMAWGRYCYDNSSGEWHEFLSHYWQRDCARNVEVLVDQVAERYRVEAARKQAEIKRNALEGDELRRARKLADDLRKRAFSLRSDARIRNVLRRATAGIGSLGIAGDEWDQHPTLLPVANGVVDLETGRLSPGRPEQYMSKASPVEFLGLNVEAPKWEEVLNQALCQNEELRDYVDRMIGYSATGLSSFKDFFCAYGPGGDNGKSVIFETLQRVLGHFGETINVSTLLDDGFVRSSAGPSPDILKLRGLRMALTSEAEKGHKFSMSKIKAIVSGGDNITAREPYAKRDVTFPPTHTLILHTNFLPRAKGNDKAFFNRLRVIPFRAQFVLPGADTKPDPENHIYEGIPREVLDRILEAEGPGILAYIIRCAMRFLKDLDLTPPQIVRAETGDYQDEQDLVGRFMRTCCEVDAEHGGEQMGIIHASFKRFCIELEGYEETGKKSPPSHIWLARDFKSRPEIRRLQDKPVVKYGLRIRPEWLPDAQGDLP